MTDQKKEYEYTITYATDRDGNENSLKMNDIPFDVYKASKAHFTDHPDKSIRIILNSCADEKGKIEALKELDKNNIVAILSLETAISQLITPVVGELKKN
jgi:hypothetical protein